MVATMSKHIRETPLLTETEAKIALRRTVPEWMEMYASVIHQGLIARNADGQAMETWRNEVRPRLKRIAGRFQVAGLVLSEEMEFAGPVVTPQGIIWPKPHDPRIVFFWPDGSDLRFAGPDALSAVGFFVWWSNLQTPILGAKVGEAREVLPGSIDHDHYMRGKNGGES